MDRYLAHIAEDGREQTVEEHLLGTAELCASFAAVFGAGEQGRLAGLAHDIGKYSAAFQKRLRGGPKVDHATAGGVECARLGQNYAAQVVMGHHGGLPDGGGRGDSADEPTFCGRLNRWKAGRLEPYDAWADHMSLPSARQPDFCGKDPLTDVFFTRMLYSCLVDADFLDTEAFMRGRPREKRATEDMGLLLERLRAYIADCFPPKNALNERRCAILENCLVQGEARKPGLFTLTVPTGGGKTVASLAFALAHAKAHGLRRVVYVIPYTSIIDQTAQTFRKVLGPENVLEHHSGVTYDLDEKGELTAENQALANATENWDMPVIVTTAVQFFESLYAAHSSKCRKLHNLAGSVIIFDEAQMLPVPYLRPCVSAIAQLVAHYGASAVLCTATQPALGPLFREFLPGVDAVELCPQVLSADPIFRRVTFRWEGQLTWDEVAARMNGQDQALCVVNRRKDAAALYEKLDGDGRFYLTTLMVPAHRREALDEIRRRLEDGLPCRVAATSLVEAGVDVDFPAVFREEAGLDSILQAAGRCNREGNRPMDESVVTVFRGEGRAPRIFRTAIETGRDVMEQHGDIASQTAISQYFSTLLYLKGNAAQDQKNILPLLREQRRPFREVEREFKLIETDTRTIYIPWREGEKLVACLKAGERSRTLFRELGQYSVAIYKDHLSALDRAGALELLDGELVVLTSLRFYSEETGLTLAPDTGVGLFA